MPRTVRVLYRIGPFPARGSRGMLKAFAVPIAGVMAGLAGPAVAGEALALTYRATLLGMPLASASAEVVPGGDSYRLEGEMETRGVVGLFSRWHHRRSEEHTSELQSLMRISYAVF